jgi:hypothetical protein
MIRSSPIKPAFHTPMRLEWTEEKLQLLDQDQLLNLLLNLDHQRRIGRIGQEAAESLERRITPLLSGRSVEKRRKVVIADGGGQAPA